MTEVAHRPTHLLAEIEPVGGARPLHPLDARRGPRDVGIDVVRPRRAVHGRHHGPARPDVLDPGRLVERCGQVVVGEHQDRVLGLAPGQDHDVGPGLIALVGDPVEARQIEDVERRGDRRGRRAPAPPCRRGAGPGCRNAPAGVADRTPGRALRLRWSSSFPPDSTWSKPGVWGSCSRCPCPISR